MPQPTQPNPNAIAQNPVTRLSLFIQPGHNSIDIHRQESSRQTTGRTIDAMIDAMDQNDAAALIAFCQNVISYTGRPAVTVNPQQPQQAYPAGLRRI